MKILELFSGYGTASFALKRIFGEEGYECVGYSDIDKYANQCFQQNHGGKEFGDVTKIDEKNLPDFDLLTGGFPCQAFSVAGKMQGEADPRGTLFYEIIRIAEHKQPKYMLLENVKGLTSKKFKDTFNKILSELDRIGYDVYWDVLNTKDYGIPQSRARVWFVCFRKDLNRKDFKFPEKEELKIFIKDILEPEVDEKYYLSEKLQERFAKYLEEKKQKICAMRGRNPDNPKSRESGLPTEQMIEFQEEPISNTISTVQKDNLVYTSHRANEIREYSNESPTLKTTMGTGGNNVPLVVGTHQKDLIQPLLGSCSTITSTMWKQPPMVANCLDSNMHKGVDPVGFYEKSKRNIVGVGKLRRLTPKECFRLQGFLNDEVDLTGLSDTQRYKLAGNGQSVNVVEKIFKEMFK